MSTKAVEEIDKAAARYRSHPKYDADDEYDGGFVRGMEYARELVEALTASDPRNAPPVAEVDPVEASIDIIARYILWRLVDIETVLWEEYPDLGEYDFERILKRVEELRPPCPDALDREDAYEFLSGRTEEM